MPNIASLLNRLGFGRLFRRLGLPFWTFLGIGVSAIWFNYFGLIIEKSVRDAMGLTSDSKGWRSFVPMIVVAAIPLLLVVAAMIYQHLTYRLTKLKIRSGSLPQPDGKRGLILLVSNPDSALYAIGYHLGKCTLEKVWLLPSNGAARQQFGNSTLAVATKVKEICAVLKTSSGANLDVEVIESGVSPADSQDTFDSVNRIYRNSGYEIQEIIADFTGGTKPMSVGMIMACLPADRELEYVSFSNLTKQSFGPFLIDYQHRAFDLIG